jgi:hypothetical protein
VIAREEISRGMRVEKMGDVVVVVLPGERLDASDAEGANVTVRLCVRQILRRLYIIRVRGRGTR